MFEKFIEAFKKNSTNKKDEIYIAIQNNRYQDIFDIVSSGFDVKKKYDNDDTLLHIAALYGNEQMVELFLQKQINPNAKNSLGCTPLHNAVWKGNVDSCVKLIKAGANIDEEDYDGNTPLHYAAIRNNNVIISTLICYKANIDALNKERRTPLHEAIILGNDEALDHLLKLGANDKIEDIYSFTVNDYIKHKQ